MSILRHERHVLQHSHQLSVVVDGEPVRPISQRYPRLSTESGQQAFSSNICGFGTRKPSG